MATNLIYYGGFDGAIDADYWTGGTICRSLGYPRLGCVELVAGQSVRQGVELSGDQLYTLHYFYQLAVGATLNVTVGAIAQEHTGAPLSVWREGVLGLSVGASIQANVQFTAIDGDCYVDTVSLILGAVPVYRSGLALVVAARLSTLATDAELSTMPSIDGPEGSYSAAIDEALRQVGAVNEWGDPDVCQLEPGQVNVVLEAIQTAMLQQLRSKYALETDVSLGPRRESRSQIAASIDAMLSGAGSNRRVATGRLFRRGGWER